MNDLNLKRAAPGECALCAMIESIELGQLTTREAVAQIIVFSLAAPGLYACETCEGELRVSLRAMEIKAAMMQPGATS